MVKRYDFEIDGCGGCDMCGVTAEECATGDYVLYDDYVKVEKALIMALEAEAQRCVPWDMAKEMAQSALRRILGD